MDPGGSDVCYGRKTFVNGPGFEVLVRVVSRSAQLFVAMNTRTTRGTFG